MRSLGILGLALVALASCSSGVTADGLDSGLSPSSSLIALRLEGGQLRLAVGETIRLNASVTTSGELTLYTIAFKSSEPGTVSVTGDGVLTGVADGEAVVGVTATLIGSGASDTAQVSVVVGAPPADVTWTWIAGEHDSFTVPPGSRVRYGKEPNWVEKTMSGAGMCDNGTFGDPDVGSYKTCWVASSPGTVDPSPPPAPPPSGDVVSATFRAAPDMAIDNPERGFYIHLTGNEFCDGFGAQVRDGVYENQPVRLIYYDYDPRTSLTTFDANLACMRAIGVKVIISITYCSSLLCDEGVSIDELEQQFRTMKPHLYANRDVIAHFRISAAGGWGESASWNTVSPPPAGIEERIRDASLDACPPEIPMTLRHPPILQAWFPAPISAANAYNGAPQSRIGLNNDCFMAGPDDRFTYPGALDWENPPFTGTGASQRAYATAVTNYAPFGFETCPARSGETARYGCYDIDDNAGQPGGIMNEGPRYHVTYGHRAYDHDFITRWQDDGCYDQVNNLMGYRFQLDGISHGAVVARGAALDVDVAMRNTGWSRIHSARTLHVRLTKTGAPDIVCNGATPLRNLDSQATRSSTVRVSCMIPQGAATGNYAVHLEMPDVYPTTQARLFTIQPANANDGAQVWDDQRGRFSTGTAVTIQ